MRGIMTTINVSKNQLISKLFGKLVIGLAQLSNADLELRQVITKLNLIRGNLFELPVEETLALLNRASYIAQGYDPKDFKSNEFVASLEEIIPAIQEELENLILESKLNKAASLFILAGKFEKLAQ